MTKPLGLQRALLMCGLVAGLLAGCGGASNTPMGEEDFRKNNLLEVGEVLRMYQMEKGKPPESLAEVEAVESLEMVAPMGLEPIRKGEVVVRWGREAARHGRGARHDSRAGRTGLFQGGPHSGGSGPAVESHRREHDGGGLQGRPRRAKNPRPRPIKAHESARGEGELSRLFLCRLVSTLFPIAAQAGFALA